MQLGVELGLGPGDFVLDGDPAPLIKRGGAPQIFCPCLLWSNGWMDQDRTWHGGRPQPRRPFDARWRPSPLPKKGAEPPPQFLAHFYCGQRAGCTKIPLGMELGLSPGDFVSAGDSAPPKKGGGAHPSPPKKKSTHIYCGQTAGWMKLVHGMEVCLSPADFVSDGDPALSPKRGRSPLPNFWPISIVAKRLDASRCHLAWM